MKCLYPKPSSSAILKMMFKSIIFLSSVFLPCLCIGQTTVSFLYDEAGNRTNRYIPLGGQSQSFKSTEGIDTTVYKETFGERKVLIYPNPTKGQLRVEIQGREDEEASISLFGLTGALLISKTLVGSSETLDLSNYPHATYILKVVLGDKTSEWMIIKE